MRNENLYIGVLSTNLKMYKNYTITKVANKTNDRNENRTFNSNPSIWISEKL